MGPASLTGEHGNRRRKKTRRDAADVFPRRYSRDDRVGVTSSIRWISLESRPKVIPAPGACVEGSRLPRRQVSDSSWPGSASTVAATATSENGESDQCARRGRPTSREPIDPEQNVAHTIVEPGSVEGNLRKSLRMCEIESDHARPRSANGAHTLANSSPRPVASRPYPLKTGWARIIAYEPGRT